MDSKEQNGKKNTKQTDQEQNQDQKKISKKMGNRKEGVALMSTATVQMWGNSLGVRIPREVADRAQIDRGTKLDMMVTDNDEIVLVPTKTRRRRRNKYTLEELVSQITPENRHAEIDFGIEGNELI